MDKVERSRIRNAAREILYEEKLKNPRGKPEVRIRRAVGEIRERYEEDPDEAGDLMHVAATQRSLRLRAGQDAWELFMDVNIEKWGPFEKAAIREFNALNKSARYQKEREANFFAVLADAQQKTDAAVLADPRIQEAFKGREELLKEALAFMNERVKKELFGQIRQSK